MGISKNSYYDNIKPFVVSDEPSSFDTPHQFTVDTGAALRTNGSLYRTMNGIFTIFYSLVLLLWAGPLAAQTMGITSDSLPVTIGPFDPHIQLSGRFDTSDPHGPRCAWTGSSITVCFKGRAINVILDGHYNYFTVMADDSVRGVLAAQAGRQRYRIISGLKDTTHVITLFRRSEAFFGVEQLFGFELEAKGTLLTPPPLPQRKMEIIGNSITCGSGNEAPSETTKFGATFENGYLAYGAVTARSLKAQYRAVAWSGKGMCTNFDKSKKDCMPVLYERTIPQDSASRWGFGTWVPDVVVINLGTNDYSHGSHPSEEEFIGAYRSFVRKLRVHYPQAHIFCLVGPMLVDPELTTIRGYVTRMVEDFHRAGDHSIHFMEMDQQNGKLNGMGAAHHPNIKTNQLMADQLTAAISKAMHW